jgi:LPS O-antigen subunit length determinant protein (WzzB/FepE family)
MENFNSPNILITLFRNRKTLLMVVLAAAVLSFLGSFLLKEKYKSLAIVYPINMYENSEESTTEQLIQYFLSEDVKNQLAKEFRLYEKYGVDTVNEKGGRALFNYMFQENFKVSPTLYESIEISVTDGDPAMAQKFNARMIVLTNLLIRENKQKTMRQYVVNADRIISSEQKELDSMSTEIAKIRQQYGIVDEKQQSKELGKELAKGSGLKEHQSALASGLKEKVPHMNMLRGRIKSTLKAMVDLKEQKYKYLLDSQGEVDFVLYVSNPSLPDKRSYPVRWIIVLLSVLTAAAFTTMVILIRNRVKATQ